jgi:hypothetical protein
LGAALLISGGVGLALLVANLLNFTETAVHLAPQPTIAVAALSPEPAAGKPSPFRIRK